MEPSFAPWCDLPVEMRLECIKWMDFPSRMQLRATSTMDKYLVGLAPKFHFDSVKIDLDLEYTSKVVCKENGVETVEIKPEDEKRTPEFVQKANKLVFQILKFAAIDDFEFSLDFGAKEDVSEFVSVISSCSSFRFLKLALHIPNFEIVKVILTRIRNPEHLELEINMEHIREPRISELFEMETVVKAKRVLWRFLPHPEFSHRLIQKWVENESEIGQTQLCVVAGLQCMKYLAEKLENRIVSNTDRIIRIRTDDDSKHVLIRFVPHSCVFLLCSYISIVLIPADLKESEYETNKDEQWVRSIHDYAFVRSHDRYLLISND